MLVWPQASSTEVTELFTNAAMTLTFFATDGEANSVWGPAGERSAARLGCMAPPAPSPALSLRTGGLLQ